MTIRILSLLFCFLLAGCSSAESTDHLAPVKPFDTVRYMGKWYEQARFPHRFEKDLRNVTAHYTLQKNGTVTIENQGVLPDGTIKTVRGVAFQPTAGTGLLRVSFFRPFYGDYKIIFLEKDYSAAIVTSGTTDYLWILTRTETLSEQKKQQYLDFIRQCGFPLEKLEWQ